MPKNVIEKTCTTPAPEDKRTPRLARMIAPWNATPVHQRHALLLAFEQAYDGYSEPAFGSEYRSDAVLLWVFFLLETPGWEAESEVLARVRARLTSVFETQEPFQSVIRQMAVQEGEADPFEILEHLRNGDQKKYYAMVERQAQGLKMFHERFIPKFHPELSSGTSPVD